MYKIYKNKALEIVQNKGNRKSKKRSRRKRWRNGREKKKKKKNEKKKKKQQKGKKKELNTININIKTGKSKLMGLRVPSLFGCPGKVFYRVTEEDWILSLKYLSSVQSDCELSVHPVALYHIGLYLGSDCLIDFALCTLLPKDAPYFLEHISDPKHCKYVKNIISQYEDNLAFAFLPPELRRNLLLLYIWSSAGRIMVGDLGGLGPPGH